jgi:GNAT superfamily N-acetyltransferase
MIHNTCVRKFRPQEWPIYKSLRLSALTDAPHAFGSTLEAELLRSDALWCERLQKAAGSDRDCPLLAEVAGVPAGLAWAKFDILESDVVNIFQMWVAPDNRGRGTGAALLQAAINWALLSGARFVKLGVSVGDTPAVKLYHRAGFIFFGDEEALREGSSVMAKNMVLTLPQRAA